MDISKETTDSRRFSSSDESAIETEGLLQHTIRASHRGSQRLHYSLLFLLCGLIALSSSAITILVLRHQNFQNHCEDLSVNDGSLLRDIDRSWHLKWFPPFNYSGSPYTADPGVSDPDAAWNELGVDFNNFVIPHEQGALFGLDPQHNVMHVNEDGTVPGYMAIFEVTHQLHCLDVLRQNLHFNHEHYSSVDPLPSGHASHAVDKAHINHCVDALREKLMCGADIGVVPWVWSSDPHFVTQPNFVRQHQCHDFEAVRNWARERQVKKVAREEDLVVPEDAIFTDLVGEVPF
ncbi:hypothetical protein TI39_contig4372g00002 [Zymoseptoria brevis]|uniref:Uncharacterized protein n=1 Tax=Zymoseptoria brevis TaxID=1047168 RepID=A0A0F4G744_9PEZI|nr:hypothetical protein TI39_contig4372g00002 [Zymoseptoria brevis]